jgi:hypothetical protein
MPSSERLQAARGVSMVYMDDTAAHLERYCQVFGFETDSKNGASQKLDVFADRFPDPSQYGAGGMCDG